jgi:prevent-host-death family protein
MVERMGAREARNKFADLLGNVHYGGQVIIVERFGSPMVAVIPAEMYQRFIAWTASAAGCRTCPPVRSSTTSPRPSSP